MSGTNGGYGRERPRLSPEDLRDVFARHDRGETRASIARVYGCSPGAIFYHLKRTGRHVPLRDRYSLAPPVHGAADCIRCGIDLGRPGMCLDCLEVLGFTADQILAGVSA